VRPGEWPSGGTATGSDVDRGATLNCCSLPSRQANQRWWAIPLLENRSGISSQSYGPGTQPRSPQTMRDLPVMAPTRSARPWCDAGVPCYDRRLRDRRGHHRGSLLPISSAIGSGSRTTHRAHQAAASREPSPATDALNHHSKMRRWCRAESPEPISPASARPAA
jgi:hypothetical protein